MADESTLRATETAMVARLDGQPVDLHAAYAISSVYRAANAIRNHMTATVLRPHDLTWTGFVVLWVVWIWESMEARRVAEAASISKATLSGVIKTLVARGLLERVPSTVDRRLVHLRLSPAGAALMQELYPRFNAAEAELIDGLSDKRVAELTRTLRRIVTTLEARSTSRQ